MGAARLLAGLIRVVPPADLTAIVNVGDDVELHGLHISPDLDTITYTVAGAIDPERGWGLAGETWQAIGALRRYPSTTAWFNLGDKDLATHLFRTDRLRAGAPLSQVTGEIAEAWALGLRLLPATDGRLRTRVTIEAVPLHARALSCVEVPVTRPWYRTVGFERNGTRVALPYESTVRKSPPGSW